MGKKAWHTEQPPVPEGFVLVPAMELAWLANCSDSQMRDGDTARELARKWLAAAQTGGEKP